MQRLMVIQTGGSSAVLCRKAAKALGMSRNDVHITGERPSDWSEAFVRGEKQLLVMGTFHGDMTSAENFARKAKRLNPDLTIWFCSLMGYKIDHELFEREFGRDCPREYRNRYAYMMAEARKFLASN